MAKYRKKPVEVEAVQWTGFNFSEICTFMGRSDKRFFDELYIETFERVEE